MCEGNFFQLTNAPTTFITNSYLQKCNVLMMAVAQIGVPVMSQLEPAFVIPDFKEIHVKVKYFFS